MFDMRLLAANFMSGFPQKEEPALAALSLSSLNTLLLTPSDFFHTINKKFQIK